MAGRKHKAVPFCVWLPPFQHLLFALPSTLTLAPPAADLSLLKPSVLQQVAAAAPVLLVADPGTKPETGLVLSVAPLMGALPRVDAKHARWLHVQVQRRHRRVPPVRRQCMRRGCRCR